jgi:hypothetical protein
MQLKLFSSILLAMFAALIENAEAVNSVKLIVITLRLLRLFIVNPFDSMVVMASATIHVEWP